MPTMTTVGLKASLNCATTYSTVGAGASFTVTDRVIMAITSDDATNTQIQMQQSDATTWDEVEEVGGAKVRQNANDDPVIFSGFGGHTLRTRIYNNSAGTIAYGYTYWELE